MDSTGEIFNCDGCFTTIFFLFGKFCCSCCWIFCNNLSFFSLRKYIRFLKFCILSFIRCSMHFYMGTICASNRLVCRKVSLQNKLFDTQSNLSNYLEDRYLQGALLLHRHVSSRSPKIPGDRYVTRKESWKNLEKWRHYPSKVIWADSVIFLLLFSVKECRALLLKIIFSPLR